MLGAMALEGDLRRISAIAARHAAADERVAAVLAAETTDGERVFLCAFEGPDGRTWLAFDAGGSPVSARDRVPDAVAITALCELAEEPSGGAETARVASAAYLDELGRGGSDVALAIQQGLGAVDELTREVEAGYKLSLADS